MGRGWFGVVAAAGMLAAASGAAHAAGVTQRVSLGVDGAQGELPSLFADLSADGDLVLFASQASLLVPPDLNRTRADIFLRNRRNATTVMVDVDSSGRQARAGGSREASISANGRYVCFVSDAANLVVGDTNGVADVFVRDLALGSTVRASVGPAGQGDDASHRCSVADDKRTAFLSRARNLLDAGGTRRTRLYVHDFTSDRTMVIDEGSDEPRLSAGGRFLAYTKSVAGDGFRRHILVRDLEGVGVEQIDVRPDGSTGNGDNSGGPAISGDGRFEAFNSNSSDLVAGDGNPGYDVFVRDRKLGTTARVQGRSGSPPNASSLLYDISRDGGFVYLGSDATNLVPGISTGGAFVYDVGARTVELVSPIRSASAGIADRGSAFTISTDRSLVPRDTNGVADVYLKTR